MLGIGNLCAVGVQLLAASIVSRTGIRIGKVIIVTHVIVAALALVLIWIPHSGIAFSAVFVLGFLLTKAMMPMVNSLYYGYHEQGRKSISVWHAVLVRGHIHWHALPQVC